MHEPRGRGGGGTRRELLVEPSLRLHDTAVPATRKLLLVASTGGHLWQLSRLAPRLGASADSLWATFDSPQSRSLLRDARTLFLPYVAPRDWKKALAASGLLRRALKEEEFDGVVSTGAAVAVSAMVAASRRVPARLYIESVSRFDGPSLSGRMIAACHLARTLTQHPHWSGRRWGYEGSILEDYVVEQRPATAVESLFVTLGTIRPYQFQRLTQQIVRVLPPEVDVMWQVGETDADGLPGEVHRYVSSDRFDRAVRDADAVITHAGIGTLLGLLEAGVRPVAVPRSAAFAEHVDDHQSEAARVLSERGLVVTRPADELTWEDVVTSAQASVRRRR